NRCCLKPSPDPGGGHFYTEIAMKITVHNPGSTPMAVGACYVLPGESRTFDESEVPAHLKPQPMDAEPADVADPVADLQKKPVKEIMAALPALSDDDLKRL